MSWEDVLKVLTPRMFLENIQNIVGGEIRGSGSKSGDRYTLDSERGKVIVSRKGSSAYNVRFGNFNANSYDLAKLLPQLLDSLNGEMEKVAGTVTTSSAPALFSEGRMGGGKNAKDEEKTKTKNGNTASQELKSTTFFKEFQEWKELEGVGFLLRHGIKSTKHKRRTGMETIEGSSRGHRDHLPKLIEIMDYDDFIGETELNYIRAYIKFIDAAKGKKADPARIPYHNNIYDKAGKLVGRKKVYGHWKTAEFVKYSKKYKGDAPVPESWYSYDVNNLGNPPPHQVIYSEKSPKGLKYILEDALKELDDADLKFEITRLSNPKELYRLSQVKQFLESQLTPALVKEGVINAKAIAGKLAGQKFGVTGEAEEAIVRRLSGFSEEEVAGDVEEFTVKVSPAVVERAYLASTKKKVGGFYLHGKVLDKRPRDSKGEPVAKSWLDILKRTGTGGDYPHWMAMLVEYDLPIAIAKQLRSYMRNLVNRSKGIELSAKLSRLHQFNRGSKIGSISKEIEKLVMKYDRPKNRSGVHPRRTEDINLLTEPQLEQVAKYTIHLIEQA